MATACLPQQPTPSKSGFLHRLRTFSSSKPSSSTTTQAIPARRTTKPRPDAPNRRITLFGPLPAVAKPQAENGYIPVHRDQRTAALRALGLEPVMTLSEMEKEMDEKYSKPMLEPVSRSSVNGNRDSQDSARVAGPGDMDDSGSEADRIREAWVARQSGGYSPEAEKEKEVQSLEADSQSKNQCEHIDAPASPSAPQEAAQSGSLSSDYQFPPTQTRAKSLPLVPIITHPRVESQSAEVQTWSDRPLSGSSSIVSPSGWSESSCSEGPITPMLPTMQVDVARVRRPSKESGGGYRPTSEVIVEDLDDEDDAYPSDPEFGGLSKDLPRLQSYTTPAKGVSASAQHTVVIQKRGSIFGRGSSSNKQQIAQAPASPPRQPRTRNSFASLGSKLGLRSKSFVEHTSSTPHAPVPQRAATTVTAASVPVARPRPRPQATLLAPTMHNRASMVVEAGKIADEETRRLTEAAFLDF